MSAGRQTTSSSVPNTQTAAKPRPALDPRSPGLIQPYKGLVESGVIARLTVEFTPMGVSIAGYASSRLAEVEGSGLNTTDAFPLGRLLEIAEANDMVVRPGKKKKSGGESAQAKPGRSLCREDFSLSPAALQQRINEIARACGGGPLVGRVRSAGRFEGSSTTSYQDWWEAADGHLRALSLSEGKRYATFTDEEVAKLGGLQCPFRGTLEFAVSKATGEKEEVQTSSFAADAGKSRPKRGAK